MSHLHNKNELITSYFVLVAVVLLGIMSTLGSGGGGGDDNPGKPYYGISITDPSSDKVVTTSVVTLYGDSDCPTCPSSKFSSASCPSISCPSTTGLDLIWINHTTGQIGPISQQVFPTCQCSAIIGGCVSWCEHSWLASVPILWGPNVIEVAADEQGGSDSDSITITRISPTPINLTAVAGHNQVMVSWDSVPEAISYNIYWSTSRTITTDTATKITDATSPTTLTGLSDDETYYFLVEAVNVDNDSFVSDVALATAGWSTETVAETFATTKWRATSIAMDSGGNAHIYYSYDEHRDPITRYYYSYYTTNKTGIWSSVYAGSGDPFNASIALDSNDIVHIGSLDTYHRVDTAGNWTTEVVDTKAWCNSSLALDATGKPHFAYNTYIDQDIDVRYANNMSGSWTTTTIDTYASSLCSNTGRRVSLAMDANGNAHIAYTGTYGYGLKYATNAGGVWSVSIVDNDPIYQVSLAVDINGGVHIAYTDVTDSHLQLWYAKIISGIWSVEPLLSSGSPQHPSIAVDASGKVHITYYDDGYRELSYTTNLSGEWQVIPIDRAGLPPSYMVNDTAIALDSQGKVYLSYDSGNSIKFATNR